MELDTVNAYSIVGMEQGLSGETWDCLFGSDSISDAFQGRPEMLHMGIRSCDNTGQVDWLGPGLGLGFDFDDVLTETDEDPVCFNDKSRSSNSNLDELNLDSDSELALTLDPNLILPRNMPIRSPATNSDAAMLETASVEENAAENDGEDSENESEVERTENDEDNESEEEEEIENEHNESEYESEEEQSEEEQTEEDEETEDDEQDATTRQSLAPLNVEAPTSISSSSAAGVGARTLTAVSIAASSPTIQLTRLHHPKISTITGTVKVQDLKMMAASPGGQALQQIRKQMSYNNNVHDVSTGATTTVMIQTAKREKELTTGNRDNSYPKPAYSYSCLIAMALKNSRTGSLPVSEIYNFMCRHFPYFTTAPTGWKNSVRHNLSLNKCFEKIEKPPGNGSQRKGCLWAIHPSKVAKMDEEVRKWSRKDPTAIKRAMVNPEQLELLERGEMKHEGDRQDEAYEDAESYADSETGGSVADEVINDDENVTYDEAKQIDIVDDDIVVEQLYEDLELMNAADLLDTRLSDFPRPEQPLVYEFVSCAKRQKTLSDDSAIQNDYVYQQVDAASPRKKAHLVALRPGATAPSAGSLLEAE